MKPFPTLYFSFVLIFLICSFSLQAQGFKEQKANRFFEQTYYSKAIPLYEELIQHDKSPVLLRNLADCYYFTFSVEKAAHYYGILEARYPEKLDKQHYFQYIQTLKALNHSKEAIEIAQKHLYTSEEEQEHFQKNLTYIANIKAIGNRFDIKNLALNTAASEFGAVSYKKNLVYATTQKQQGLFSKIYYWNNTPYLNLYELPKDSLNNSTNEPILFSKELTSRFHEASAIFTADGNTVYFTRNNYIDGKKTRDEHHVTQLQIYRASYKDGKWKNITSLPINSDSYSTEHPALNPTEDTLYFSSNKPGGYGDFDLYKVSTNDFQNPENLGPEINTEHKEQFPFIDSNGNLYFASDGHPGFGFLDVFVATPNGNGFNKPDNIGLPVNSGYDDFAYYTNQSTGEGYFSSNRPTGKGSDDIYKFQEKLPLIIEDCYQYISGTVTDKTTGELLANAKVVLVENSMLKDSITTNAEATFKFKVNCESTYWVKGSKKEFQPDSIRVITNDLRKKEYNAPLALMSNAQLEEIKKENLARQQREIEAQRKADSLAAEKVKIAKVKEKEEAEEKRKKVIVANEESIVKDPSKNRFLIKTEPIYFDYDLWYIRKESRVILNKVISLMKKYPSMQIEIGTHTDVRGNNQYNMDLSQKRSNSVLAYFKENGIDKSRIVAKGYGETQPIIKCVPEDSCTEEQHEINRRCEFVILSF